MKITLSSLFLFLCIFTLHATHKIVERPVFTAWSSQTLEIDKIVLNETETLLFIDAFFTPNWWIRIDSRSFIRANGKEYPIQRADGINLNEETYMPESGTLSFQLIFPAIPTDTKEIDFQESYDTNDFCIWGIRLDGELPPINTSLLTKQENTASFNFEPEVSLYYKEAIVNLNILGYKPEMNLEGSIQANNFLTDQTFKQNLQVNPDGKATISIPLLRPTHVWIQASYMNRNVYLIPGEEVTITINLPEKTRIESRYLREKPSTGEPYYFAGSTAELNKGIFQDPYQEVNLYADSREEHDEMMKQISTMNAQEYKAYFQERYREKTKAIEGLKNTNNAYYNLLIQDAELQLIHALLSGKSLVEYAYRTVNKLDQQAELPEEIQGIFTKDYYSFLRESLPGTSQLLYSGSLSSLTQNLPFYLHITGINDEKKEELPSLTEILGTDKGFIFDLLTLTKLAEPVNNMKPLTPAQLTEIEKISSEAAKYLAEVSEQIKRTIEKNSRPSSYDLEKINIHDIAEDELFSAIIYPYRNKVIFVDFWATWCGPCIQAMKVSEPVKDEFDGKEVVFLYLAGENSPLNKWEEMRGDIKGVHYRVTGKQWDYWMNNFGIQGIPAYMVVGKDGIPVHFQTGFMGVENMRKLLNTELEK